jgi:hypothetical protein
MDLDGLIANSSEGVRPWTGVAPVAVLERDARKERLIIRLGVREAAQRLT